MDNSIDDSFGSLWRFAWRLFPRLSGGIVVLFLVIALPAEILAAFVGRAAEIGSIAEFGRAFSSGALSRAGIVVAAQTLLQGGYQLCGTCAIALADAEVRGESSGVRGALRSGLVRAPAQLWTILLSFALVAPLVLAPMFIVPLLGSWPLFAVLFVLLPGPGLAVYFMLRWWLFEAVVQLEGLSGAAALRRSLALSGARLPLNLYQVCVISILGILPPTAVNMAWARFLPEWVPWQIGEIAGYLLTAPLTTGLMLALFRREAARLAAQDAAPAA